MKKLLSVLLVLAMSVTMLAGCGKDDNGGKSNETGAGAQGEDGAAQADGEVYKMVMEIITYGFDDPDLQMVQDAVNEITVPKIGVEVQFLTVPIAEMSTKLGLLVSGGEQIDLVCAGLLTTPANLAADGLIVPITEYVENSETLSSLSEGIIEACKVNGEIYAYPGSTAPGTQAVFCYDADLAAEYNIQVPEKLTTAEEWEGLFQQIIESGMEQYAVSLGDGIAAEPQNSGMAFDPLGDSSYCAYGVVMDRENNTTVENWYATEEYKEKCKMHRSWFVEGYAVPDSISNGYSTMDSMTQGMIFGYPSQGGVGMSDAYFSRITGKNVASVPMSDVCIQTGNVTNFSWGVSSTCQKPEKVIQFLELLYSDTELANLMNYGIEGTHYVTREGSQIIGYPEGLDSSSVGYGAFVGSYGDISKIYQRDPLTDEFLAAIPDYAYGKAKASPFMGYTFDPSNVSTELTAVTAVIGQYAPALECGTVDPETMIPEFLEALEAAGISKIIEENQAQLNEWLSQK